MGKEGWAAFPLSRIPGGGFEFRMGRIRYFWFFFNLFFPIFPLFLVFRSFFAPTPRVLPIPFYFMIFWGVSSLFVFICLERYLSSNFPHTHIHIHTHTHMHARYYQWGRTMWRGKWVRMWMVEVRDTGRKGVGRGRKERRGEEMGGGKGKGGGGKEGKGKIGVSPIPRFIHSISFFFIHILPPLTNIE